MLVFRAKNRRTFDPIFQLKFQYLSPTSTRVCVHTRNGFTMWTATQHLMCDSKPKYTSIFYFIWQTENNGAKQRTTGGYVLWCHQHWRNGRVRDDVTSKNKFIYICQNELKLHLDGPMAWRLSFGHIKNMINLIGRRHSAAPICNEFIFKRKFTNEKKEQSCIFNLIYCLVVNQWSMQ